MTHFGIICPPYPGHLNPLSALGRELQGRGHRVTILHISDLEAKIRSEGLEYYPIGQTSYQPGSLAVSFKQLTQFSEIEALRYSVDFCRHMTEIICQDAPAAIRSIGIEALLVDQLEPEGQSVAQYLDLPFICISSGQTIHRRSDVPLFFTPWTYSKASWTRLRNTVAYQILDWSCQPILGVINHYRQRWKLPPYRKIYESIAKTHISQQPAAFEFPQDTGRGMIAFADALDHFVQHLPIHPVLLGNVYDPSLGDDSRNFLNITPTIARKSLQRINAIIQGVADRHGQLVDLHTHFLTGEPSWFTAIIEPSLRGASEVRRAFLPYLRLSKQA